MPMFLLTVALAEKIPGKPNATGSRVPVKRSELIARIGVGACIDRIII